MTNDALHISVLALGVAAFAWLTPLSPARADSPPANNATPSLASPAPTSLTAPSGPAATAPTANPAPAQSAATPSLGEPAPTSKIAESGTANARPPSHAYSPHAYRRHYARAYVHRYRENENPVTAAAHGVVAGVSTLGSVAAYPIYCFPNYGSCHLRRLTP